MKPRRKIRTVAVFPTMFTLGNLVCGFFAIVVASRVGAPKSDQPAMIAPVVATANSGPLAYLADVDPTHNAMLSGWLIFMAMIFDALDGHVARLSNTSSEFGAQLDSLCDLVTFGVAPGFLLVKMCPEVAYNYREAVWFIAALYTACTALRLARFNVETSDSDDHSGFSGLPSPAAAASIAGFAILFYTIRQPRNASEFAQNFDWCMQRFLPCFATVVALLMVSRIPYPHIVSQMFRGQRGFSHVIGLAFALVGVMIMRGYSIPILACSFVLWPPIKYLWQRLYLRTRKEEPLFD